jgi:hypothetical protein
MSITIEASLLGNLHDVFGQRDPVQRPAAIQTLFTPDCAFTDPHGRYVGREALNDAVAALQHQLPDLDFAPVGAPDVLQDGGRLAWAFGPPDDPRRITGLDVIVVDADQIAALYTFWTRPTPDRRPWTNSMSRQRNIAIAQTLLAGISEGRVRVEIAAPFGPDLLFEIQGHGVLPWAGFSPAP